MKLVLDLCCITATLWQADSFPTGKKAAWYALLSQSFARTAHFLCCVSVLAVPNNVTPNILLRFFGREGGVCSVKG